MEELRIALKLASEEELEELTQILFCRRLNPFDYWQTPSPLEIQSLEKETCINSIEKRFQFLAADGVTILRRQTHKLTYRQILINVCSYLKIPYSQQWHTLDIEREIFLQLLQQAWHKLPHSQQQSLREKIIQSLRETPHNEPLPLSLQHDPLKFLITGSSFVAVNSILKSWILKKIYQQFAFHFATYQVAKNTLIQGGITTMATIQNHFTLKIAQRGMMTASVRYTATKTIFAFLGPALWAYFFADLGWRAIAINYTRIIPVIFTIAQIRLTRSEEWQLA